LRRSNVGTKQMSKYAPLGDYLKKQRTDVVSMTFREIERVTGVKLPPSSVRHRPWWSNNPKNSVLTKIWVDAGFKSEQVDMAGRKLVFRRVYKPGSGNAGDKVPHPAFGALKGLIRVAPGTDLTKPAAPNWGKAG
jgi:hypothetical protein